MARSLRILCPGATAAGVVCTLLVVDRATFTATPLPDGRWEILAEVSEMTATRVEIQMGQPVVIETGASLPEAPPPALPALLLPPPVGETAPPSPDGEIEDQITFTATGVRAAKTKATQMAAAQLRAHPYDGSLWTAWKIQDGVELFTRAAYRGKKNGEIILGVGADGQCSLGWRGHKAG